jgi:hypothetical protein
MKDHLEVFNQFEDRFPVDVAQEAFLAELEKCAGIGTALGNVAHWALKKNTRAGFLKRNTRAGFLKRNTRLKFLDRNTRAPAVETARKRLRAFKTDFSNAASGRARASATTTQKATASKRLTDFTGGPKQPGMSVKVPAPAQSTPAVPRPNPQQATQQTAYVPASVKVAPPAKTPTDAPWYQKHFGIKRDGGTQQFTSGEWAKNLTGRQALKAGLVGAGVAGAAGIAAGAATAPRRNKTVYVS